MMSRKELRKVQKYADEGYKLVNPAYIQELEEVYQQRAKERQQYLKFVRVGTTTGLTLLAMFLAWIMVQLIF